MCFKSDTMSSLGGPPPLLFDLNGRVEWNEKEHLVDILSMSHHVNYIITCPFQFLFFLFKINLIVVLFNFNWFYFYNTQFENSEVNWNRVLQNDPLNCALSLICQISAGAENQNKESRNINAFVQWV